MNPITDELIALAKKGQLLSREYVRRKLKAVKKREEARALASRTREGMPEARRRIRRHEKHPARSGRSARLRRNP